MITCVYILVYVQPINKSMSNIHWILQSNLIRENTLNTIKNILINDNVSFEEVKIIPFSDELPQIGKLSEINVFYGSTTLILNAYKKFGLTQGIFYDHGEFSMKTYLQKWNDKMLNHDSKILTFKEIIKLDYPSESKWFIRPIEDDKSFSGKIFSFQEICDFEKELKNSNNPYLTEETLVTISSPKSIDKEWRLFIVDKKIISSCRYSMNGELNVCDIDIPKEMIEFAENCCIEYTPSTVFVMDIALFKNDYKIVECNCFNDSGFYKHDIEKIIKKINDHLKTQ